MIDHHEYDERQGDAYARFWHEYEVMNLDLCFYREAEADAAGWPTRE